MGRRKLTEAEIKHAADRAEGKLTDEAPTTTAGRPSEYQPLYAKLAKVWCKRGLVDIEIAANLDITTTTLNRWKAKYPEFCASLKAGKTVPDDRVERSLYHKAVGYTFESEKIFQHDGEIIRAKTIEHVPPDTTACIFWLKNRRPDQWRDKTQTDLTVSGEVKFIVEDAPRMKTIEHVE
jgi:hypothetical protein